MGLLFFDDSKHDKQGFSLGAFVYTPRDPSPYINWAFQDCGLRPGIDEFKSSAYMSRSPAQKKIKGETA